jgi:hypothetical protein
LFPIGPARLLTESFVDRGFIRDLQTLIRTNMTNQLAHFAIHADVFGWSFQGYGDPMLEPRSGGRN